MRLDHGRMTKALLLVEGPVVEMQETTCEKLPRKMEHRCDLEGELTAEVYNGCYVLCLNQAILAELLAFHLGVRRGDRDRRSFGRVRVTVERINE